MFQALESFKNIPWKKNVKIASTYCGVKVEDFSDKRSFKNRHQT